MTFLPPGNPVIRRPAKVRVFDGISGPEDKCLKKTNDKGWDLSLNVSNVIEDLNLGRKGVMRLRHGCRKIYDTGKTSMISGLISVSVSVIPAYAVISGGILDLFQLPSKTNKRSDSIELTPASSFTAVSSERITTWPGEHF